MAFDASSKDVEDLCLVQWIEIEIELLLQFGVHWNSVCM